MKKLIITILCSLLGISSVATNEVIKEREEVKNEVVKNTYKDNTENTQLEDDVIEAYDKQYKKWIDSFEEEEDNSTYKSETSELEGTSKFLEEEYNFFENIYDTYFKEDCDEEYIEDEYFVLYGDYVREEL